MDTFRRLLCASITALLTASGGAYGEFRASGKLEIHYINVGQGGSTLIVGPNGTRILYDFGAYDGQRDIVGYLRNVVRLEPSDGIQYAIVSHRDRDHYMGYRAVVEAGYDVLVANYDSGSKKTPSTVRNQWINPAKPTTAGAVRPIPVGLSVALGDGAEALVVAANGRIYGGTASYAVKNENDSSIAMLIRYKNFQYLIDGDLGAGPDPCTEHETTQQDVQSKVAEALLRNGLITAEHGVDVLHIAHHGSESSTSAKFFNIMKPEVGLISVGKRNTSYLHPREDVVDKVLLGPVRPSCVSAPPVKALFQTEDGEKGCSPAGTGCTSFSGTVIGDIHLVTDGNSRYVITGTNRVHGGTAEGDPGRVWEFTMDEVTPAAPRGGRRSGSRP